MQCVLRQNHNDKLQSLSDTSVKINGTVTLEIVVGDILTMDGCVVGQLVGKKPTPEMAPFLPNFDQDLQKHTEHTEYSIEDGGVIPCKNKSTLPNASKLMLVQSSAAPDLKIGVSALLNILDAGEIMQAGTLNIPILSSFPAD